MFLAMALLISCVPSEVYAIAGEAIASGLASDEEIAQEMINTGRGTYEVTDRREENVKHFSLEDGSCVAIMYTEPVHTLDEDGNWQDIDNRLSESGNEFTTSNARIKFAKKITGNEVLFSLHDGNRKITMSLNNAIKKTTGSVTNTETEFDSEATELQKQMTLDNLSSKILYADILDGVDLEYVVESLNVKENIIVKEKKESYQYAFTISLNNLEAALREDGSVRIYDPNTMETVYNIPAGFMYDANGEYSDAVTYTLTDNGNGKYSMTVIADVAWINADERAFPVVIDPTIDVSEDEFEYQATSIHEWMPNESGYELGFLATGTYGVAYWKTEGLPADLPEGAVIQKAGFLMAAYPSLLGYDNTSFQMELGVFRVFTEWDQETLTYALYEAGAGQYSETANDSQRGASSANRYDLDITEYVKDWYNDPSTNYGLAITAIGDYSNGMDKLYRFVYGYDGAAMYIIYDDGHGYNGAENYWSISAQSAGVAGTGYVNNATGRLTFAISTLSATDNLFGYALALVYNQSGAGGYFVNASNYRTVYKQSMTGYGFMLSMQESIVCDQYVNEDGVDTDYYIWIDSDGTAHDFYLKDGSTTEYEDDDGLQLTLTMNDAFYMIEDQNHTIRGFTKVAQENSYLSAGGYLSYIEDSTGNYIDFVRNTKYQVTSITLQPVSSSTITLLTFAYNANGLIQSASNTSANQSVKFYYSESSNGGATATVSGSGYLRKIEYVFGGKTVAQAEYTYDDTGKLLQATDLTGGYAIGYAYDGKRIATIQETSTGGAVGQKLAFTYRQQYTGIRSSGSDDVHGNTDDIINAYIFDNENRVLAKTLRERSTFTA